MLGPIKSIIYSALIYISSLYFKDRRSKVIYYHDIHSNDKDKCSEMSTPITLFINHLNIIKSMKFELVKEITKPLNQIQINFDDGFQGVYKHKELFKAKNISPTVFVITSKVGKVNYLTWEELKELNNIGFNIQSHTHTHKDLNILNKETLHYELSISKQILESNLDTKIEDICFPKGLFNDLVLEACKLSDYKNWYCSIPGSSFENHTHKELRFRNLVQFSNPMDFRNILLGGLKLFKNRYTKQHYG